MKRKDELHYTAKFVDLASKIDHNLLKQKEIELKVGYWLDSVVLRLQKKNWTNGRNASIFFSIWLNDDGTKNSKLFYNIHALKLREFNGYSIQSREFALAFRERFNLHKAKWPNVRVDYGPLTLMEGFQEIDLNDFEHEFLNLVKLFLKIEHIIEATLQERKIK
jgi:hypothetical protein